MKKILLVSLFLCLPACVQAFTGNVKMTRKDGAITRSLEVSQWQVDQRGVPTFDYRYKQVGPNCNYTREGHAIARFEENGGSVELVVLNPQDANGNDGPPITFFTDRVDTAVVFEVPQATKRKFDWVSFSDRQMKKSMAKQCGFTEKNATVMFQNK